VLVHSAGRATGRRVVTAEGLELVLAAQYLARFQLTRELLPLLEASGHGRIVSIAGGGSARSELAFDNLNAEKKYSMVGALLKTSVANDLFGIEVNRRQPGVRMCVYGPGMVKGTNLGSGLSGPMRLFLNVLFAVIGRKPDDAARDVARLVREDLPGGLYQAKLKSVAPNAYVSQQLPRTRLWEASERLIAQALGA
jgi:NAD(P)-dependent dehydrogenase (short-subunit alcohol dehydrogenase family)